MALYVMTKLLVPKRASLAYFDMYIACSLARIVYSKLWLFISDMYSLFDPSLFATSKYTTKQKDNYAQLTRRSRKSQQQRALQSTSSSSLCSCSPTIFNIQINIHSDPCKTDELEDNSGVKGTLCLVGQTESGDVDSGTHGEESNGGISDGGSGMEVQSPSPTTSTISSSGSTTSSPVSSSTATETSKLPTFSPTINPTFQTSTAASTTNTQDPFMPPAGAMPVPRPSESLPTYAPSTPIPTYGTYSPTYSTYEPTNTADGESRADFIEPVKGAISIPSKKTTTYYPTVDDTYSPTDRVGHDVASLIQRVKRMNRPSGSYNTYAPSTPFPTFDTYSPTQNNDGKVTEEPKRRLLEVINLDELDQFDASQNAVEPGITEAQKPKVSDAVNAWISIPPNDEFFTRFPEWKRHQEEIYRLRHDASVIQQTSTLRKDVIEQPPRMLQSSIAVPTQLISAQFLEIDTSPDMTIINQDDSYLNLTDFYEKDITLSYTSVSATLDPNMSLEDQIDDVPGGAILVLIGQDENGELVRNRLMWTYTMKCGLSTKTVEDGDEFGWAIFVSSVML